ncbi:MAG: hypothetical protein RL701_857 [Pseudomonadota bacterium]|jgi:formiminotetrahydrofolate cyclodeaminase
MADSLWDLPLATALAETASARPTPGGGSIGPVTGAFGLGLVLMALEVTHARQPSEAGTQAIARGHELLAQLRAHADRDVEVFDAYMRALGLPRQTDDEKAARQVARDRAVVEAARAPLMAAETCLEVLNYAESVASLVQRNVWSDLLAGADIVLGALRAVLRTVDINLPALRDEVVRESITVRVAQLFEQASATYSKLGTNRVV